MTHKHSWTILMLTITSLTQLTACYRMPSEYDYSVVPATNNPDLTREKRTLPMPGVQY